MPPISSESKRELLGRTPLFSGLGARELDALAPAARVVAFKPREELFHKGDEGTQLYVVVRGKLKALTTSSEGDDVVFNILGPGEVIGEVAVLGEARRTATVTAIDACELLVLDRRDFLAFLRRNPEISVKLLALFAERLKRVSELVEDTLFLNLPIRLAKKIGYYANSYGKKEEGGAIRIHLKLSQEEWGDLVGATRESINKQLRAWSDEGLIRVDKGYVIIERPDELERLAGCMVF